MNIYRVNQIAASYIAKFDQLNHEKHKEYFKWQVAKQFKPMMDEALAADTSDFRGMLRKVVKMTWLLIDTKVVHPFSTLAQLADENPEIVRHMFLDLFEDVSNMATLQQRIERFLASSRSLKNKYFSNGKFFDDNHSVTSYLAMYDPDHHFILKPDHSRTFADYVEFYDDWGRGNNFKVDVYYRMCNQLVDAIMKNEELLAVDTKRFTGELGIPPESLYPDPAKHILAFDLIYCCKTYSLFGGIHFTKLKAKERRRINARKAETSQVISELMDNLDKSFSRYEDVLKSLDNSEAEVIQSRLKALSDTFLQMRNKEIVHNDNANEVSPSVR